MRIFSFFAILFLLSQVSQAQRLEAFSEGQNKYLEELKTYMTASKNSKMEDLYETFEKNVKSGVFSPEEVEQTRLTGNLMLGLRMTANPYFTRYLEVLTVIKNAENGAERFASWHQVLDSMLVNVENRKVKPVSDFLEFSFNFFDKNAIDYSKVGTIWLADATDYKLVFEEKEPRLIYDELNLIATRKEDSIVIKNTSGVFYPFEQIWRGKGGVVTWERFGLDPEVHAELGAYEIETKKSLYEVQEAKMHYPLFFGNKPVEGKFADKLVSQNLATGGSYPRFESKEELIEIRNIGEGIGLKAGFRLEGTTVYGFGNGDAKAVFDLRNKAGDLVFRGRSRLFTVRREERLTGEGVEATVYFEQDSIYHPSVNVRFDIPQRSLQLTRGNRGSDRNPFYSSFHNINVDVDRIDFLIDKDSIYFNKQGLGYNKREVPVVFESLNYFEESDYRRLQNIATTNPIALLKIAYEETGERVFDADRLARKLNPNFSVENINSLLYDLVSKGFVNYDAEKQQVELKDKVFLYADASQKKVDYDNLKIISETKETNAEFDLVNQIMQINGVTSIELSATQRVGLRPFGNSIRMRRNRDFDFDGRLFAGFTAFSGKDFHFEYDKFQVVMDSVRFFDVFLPTGEVSKNGQPVANSIGSRIEHLTGVLLIDAPNNKSGKDDIEIFPNLESKESSYVFYDYEGTKGGAYTRDSFYFKLDPFSLKRLDKIRASDLEFDGEMVSAGIFPVFREKLLLQEDTSLGFITNTPAGGFPTYQGKGNFKGEISLSNKGFLGSGTLSYLGAVVHSEDLVFMPKQLTGSAKEFNLAETRTAELEVPKAHGVDVQIDWQPYLDSMYVTSKEAPFELFQEGLHTLKGTLILTPGGLKARGLFDWEKASMSSDLFSFGHFSAHADTTDLKIKAFNSDELALTTSDLKGDVDFVEQKGTFKANQEFLTTTLPYNQYETSFNEFDWDMKAETVTFKTLEDKLGSFLSIHPDQDSLVFQGKSAMYDLKTNLLQIGGVPYIVASDAFIYPENGEVEVQPGAVITELKNARIIADTVNKYHVINRATVKVLGRKEYRASGFYEYNIGDKKQEIEFAEIIGTRVGEGSRSEKRSVTRAIGEIKESEQFYIDHKTLFQGTITLAADKPQLGFQGFAKFESKTLPTKHWFSVNFEGDKNDLVISYDTPLNPDGEQLHTGLFLSKETASTYPRVMSPLYFRKDRPVLPVTGVVQYDEKKDQFIFGDSLKVLGGPTVYKGNKLVYDNRTGKIDMEGRFNLGSALKNCSVAAAGVAETTFGETIVDTLMGTSAMSSETNAELMLGITLNVPDNLVKIMLQDFQSSTFDSKPIVFAKDMPFYRRTVSELFAANDEMKQVVDGISTGSLVIPKKENPFTVLFDKVPMTWDRDYQSFVSTTEKIGLMSVGGETVNSEVEAYIEVKMPTNDDDRLYFYIKSPSQLYYFFGYKQGILNIFSNNTRFMEELLGMKAKDLITKTPDGEIYEIAPVEEGTARAFLNRIKAVQKQ
ncbi:MAG: hypothetical protein CMN32_16735 [Saprospirales bacterium]|nr:hypothetical protein [Saprospirales bacterium]